MQPRMSSDSLHEILGTYSEMEALRKLTRLECLAPAFGSGGASWSCSCARHAKRQKKKNPTVSRLYERPRCADTNETVKEWMKTIRAH
jgi:hypothetical protein